MANPNRRPPTVTRTVTHEGGAAYSPDVFSELEFTAATTFLGEKTFYERADKREARLIGLVHEAVRRDAARTAELISKVRNDYKIRTASLLLAVEYVRAGGPYGRAVVESVIQRPDEGPGLLAYWETRYGGRARTGAKRDLAGLPKAIRKGVADALARQLTERNYLKYGRSGNARVSMADAIEVTHPKLGRWKDFDNGEGEVWDPQPWKHELATYILDEAHHGDGLDRYITRRQGSSESPELPMVYLTHQMGQLPEAMRRDWLRQGGPQAVDNAGYTWERLSGWLPGGMDAEAWENIIPNMGVMALLRNLSNFDAAKISTDAQKLVEAKLTDVAEVAKSRIFPYRVWQAYQNAPSDRWKYPLGTTLELAAGNLPQFDRTLFMLDISASMAAPVSNVKGIMRDELAAVMGLLAYMSAHNSSLGVFAAESALIEPAPGMSALSALNELARGIRAHTGGSYWLPRGRASGDPFHHLGHGTYLHTALTNQFDPALHDRVLVFTDEQAHDDGKGLTDHIPSIVFFNLAGYEAVTDWGKGRLHVPGYSDAAFRAVAELAR